MKDLAEEGADVTAEKPLFLDDVSTKKFIEFVNKIQAGIDFEAESVKQAQEHALRFITGLPKPEDYKELDDPDEMAEYARTNLEDIETIMTYAVGRLKSMEKVREGLPCLKDNLDPMQVVTKVAPEQFKKLVASILTLIDEIEVLKTGLNAIKDRLNSCKAKLVKGLPPSDEDKLAKDVPPSDEDKLAKALPPSDENKPTETTEKSASPESLAPVLSAVTIDDKTEVAPVEAMEPVEAEHIVSGENV